MSAPIIWIIIPFGLALILLILPWQKWAAYLGTFISLFLAGLAYWLPPDSPQKLGSISLKIDPTLTLLGRTISLTNAQQIILIFVYGIGAFWFFGTIALENAKKIAPFGLIIISMLVASMAVQPFLYAAFFIEMAVLLAVPMLAESGKKPGKGLLRFLIYQSLAMPFILLAGFLLTGVEAGPADIALISQSAFLLGLGFAFLLSIFPLYTWIPMLMQENQPYSVGFILTLFPTFNLVFGLNFIDRFSWLRDSNSLHEILLNLGLLMVITSGIWAAFQRHIGRIFGYAVVLETGVSLLALSLPDTSAGLRIAFYLFIPHAIIFAVWTQSMSILKNSASELTFIQIRGLARQFPIASIGVVLSNLTLAGMPLFALFPIRQALWEKLAAQPTPAAMWFGLANLGLWTAALRSLAVLSQAPEGTPWKINETWIQRILISIGILTILAQGIYPQWAEPFLNKLPLFFEHLGK